MTKLQALIQTALKGGCHNFEKRASASLASQRGPILPACFVDTDSDKSAILGIPRPPSSEEERAKCEAALRDALNQLGAKRYAMLSEAFMINAETEAPVDVNTDVPNHPDRIEVVMAYGYDLETREAAVAYCQILRPEFGKPSLGAPKAFTQIWPENMPPLLPTFRAEMPAAHEARSGGTRH